jgi:hypothetical protein
MATHRKDPFDRILDSTRQIQRQLERQEKTIKRLMIKLDRPPPRPRRKVTIQGNVSTPTAA